MDAQRLKAAGGRINLSGAAAGHHRMDDGGQLASGFNRGCAARLDDGAGNAARGAFFAKIPQNAGQRCLVQCHHHIGSGLARF